MMTNTAITNAMLAGGPSLRTRGVALVLVMWVIALMAILLGSFALIARTENLESRHVFDATTARYDAEAGLERAVYELRNADPSQRWIADGRPYEFTFENAQVQVEITDESGKIDLNVADATMLTSLFMSVGVDQQTAESLSDCIQDWRDPDDVPLAQGAEAEQYKQVGLSYGPRNAPFQTVSEVQEVFGMTYELYQKIEPAVTIYSGTPTPNPAFAPLEALRALPGMTDDFAQQIIALRQQMLPGQPGAQPLTLPDGTPIVVNGGGLTYSVKSRAVLPNGVSTVLDASIRSGGVGASGRPYTVLRWRDGESS
jgi:general secretion pathway protein K